MSYLSQITKRPVVDSTGAPFGKVMDLAAILGVPFPEVVAVCVRRAGASILIPWSQFAEVDHVWRLSVPASRIREFEPTGPEVLLDRDLMDKQIVDIHGARIVRVNDLNLAMAHGVLRLIGADIGLRGLLRRIGLERAADRVLGIVGWTLNTQVISWADVEQMGEAVSRLRLRVPIERLSRLHPADIADIIEQMDPSERHEVFETLDVETAADALEDMEPDVRAAIIESLGTERAADLVEEMEPDDAADLMADLPERTREEVFHEMEPEEADDVQELMNYHEGTAGGIMTTSYVVVPAHATARQVLEQLRNQAPDIEMIYYIYVNDEEGRLSGVLTLRQLIMAHPDAEVREIMGHEVISVNLGTSLVDIGQAIGHYDLLAVPVVDDSGYLQGIVTVDDVVERILPEAWSLRRPRVIRRG